MTSSHPAPATDARSFAMSFMLDRDFALTRFGHVLDSDPVALHIGQVCHARGLAREDVLPERHGRVVGDGAWIQILDTDNLNRYGQQIGFTVEPGSVWYAVGTIEDTTRLPVTLPYPGRRTHARDRLHTIEMPVHMARIETPRGPMMVFPREYLVLDGPQEMAAALQDAAFHALDLDQTGVPAEWLWYLQSRGIATVDALPLLAHAVRTQRFGYFTQHTPPTSDAWRVRLDAVTWPLRAELASPRS